MYNACRCLQNGAQAGRWRLTIRARVRGTWRVYRSTTSGARPHHGQCGTDYPIQSHGAASDCNRQMIDDIDYSNFKDEVGERQGTARAHTYSRSGKRF